MTWLLLRLPSGALDVELDAFQPDGSRALSSHPTKPDAVAAREAQAQRDEREALKAAGQGELFS